ncbi:hypothetical protein Efla_006970 [Eimeria flavescens]
MDPEGTAGGEYGSSRGNEGTSGNFEEQVEGEQVQEQHEKSPKGLIDTHSLVPKGKQRTLQQLLQGDQRAQEHSVVLQGGSGENQGPENDQDQYQKSPEGLTDKHLLEGGERTSEQVLQGQQKAQEHSVVLQGGSRENEGPENDQDQYQQSEQTSQCMQAAVEEQSIGQRALRESSKSGEQNLQPKDREKQQQHPVGEPPLQSSTREQNAEELSSEQPKQPTQPDVKGLKSTECGERRQTLGEFQRKSAEKKHPSQSILHEQPPAGKNTADESQQREGDERDAQNRKGKKAKHSKKATPKTLKAALEGEEQEMTSPVPAVAKTTSTKRATEVLFDSKTANALQSLCALQQQGQALHNAGASTDDKELEELEQCFDFADDVSQAQAFERERTERLQRVESLRTVAIMRQNLTTDKAIQGLHEALASEEVVIGFAKDASEARSCVATEVKETHRQQQERLQSQADRLRQQAQGIHDRIMQQVKEQQMHFKISRKAAAQEHTQRKEEMSRTLRSLQMRMEAILQHRCLHILKSYGLLKKDFPSTDYSLRKKIPRVATKALGFESGAEEQTWRRVPQTIRLRLDLCRAVKDGVPRGQYVMMVSVWNRLGGHRLMWTCLSEEKPFPNQVGEKREEEKKSQRSRTRALASGACAVSAPVAFAAMYYSECMRFNETVYLNCPSEVSLSPSMCLVFQLYLLRGAVSPTDKVVAWGAFPLVGADGLLLEGSFKAPLFLGEVDTSIQRYVDMENMLRRGLDCWLCNFYFRIGRLPKVVDGLQEFEAPLHYTGQVLNIPQELPPLKESRKSASFRSSRSSLSSHSSFWSTIGRSSVQRIVLSMQPHRDTVDGPITVAEDREARQKALSYGMRPFHKASEQELATYQYAVISEQTLLHRNVLRRKLRHIYNGIFDELSISSDMKEISLAAAAILFAFGALWFAVFIALFGSWVSLKAFSIPVYSAEIAGLYIRFGYVQELLSLGSAAVLAGSGFLAAIAIFALFCAVAHIAHSLIGRLPNAAYRFMAPLGIWVFLLPIVLAIIEAIGAETLGLTFTLPGAFERETGSKGIGIALTILMDIGFMAISSVLFYYYAVVIHHNGRVLDFHRRVTADPSAFSFPGDTQVSEHYLKACCYKAKQFLGLEGEIRRVQITELRVTPSEAAFQEPSIKTDEDVTIYVAIFTVHPTTKQQTLYRHFLRHPDGTIVEHLYSAPLTLDFSASSRPTEVVQRSFEEAGFLQHQPEETILSFEEWRSRRFGNMPPVVVSSATGSTVAESDPTEGFPLQQNEAPQPTLFDVSEEASLSSGEAAEEAVQENKGNKES